VSTGESILMNAKKFEVILRKAFLRLLRFEYFLNMSLLSATKTQPTLLVWVVSSHRHESSKLILIYPYIYICIHISQFWQNLNQWVEGKRGKKRVRDSLGSGGGLKFFFEEMDTTRRMKRGWGEEEMGLRTIPLNEYSCSGSRLRFSATFGWNIMSNSTKQSVPSCKY
jgi:hypothetical protein